MTKWDSIRDYINSNEVITRKSVIKNLNEKGSTIDGYLNLLRNCEFIKRIDNGVYKKLIEIPNQLTSNQLTIIAYDKIKRIKLFRKLKLEEIKKTSI